MTILAAGEFANEAEIMDWIERNAVTAARVILPADGTQQITHWWKLLGEDGEWLYVGNQETFAQFVAEETPIQ